MEHLDMLQDKNTKAFFIKHIIVQEKDIKTLDVFKMAQKY